MFSFTIFFEEIVEFISGTPAGDQNIMNPKKLSDSISKDEKDPEDGLLQKNTDTIQKNKSAKLDFF